MGVRAALLFCFLAGANCWPSIKAGRGEEKKKKKRKKKKETERKKKKTANHRQLGTVSSVLEGKSRGCAGRVLLLSGVGGANGPRDIITANGVQYAIVLRFISPLSVRPSVRPSVRRVVLWPVSDNPSSDGE